MVCGHTERKQNKITHLQQGGDTFNQFELDLKLNQNQNEKETKTMNNGKKKNVNTQQIKIPFIQNNIL